MSYTVRNMINDAAQYDAATGSLTLNVPKGGQLDESRYESYSYTMRAQVNFNRIFGKHAISRWAVLNVGWCVVLVRRIIIWDMMIIAWE